jgi:formyltetrahydrofolate-dependent phosphoribosylglycinamide formyltransferase
MFDGLQKKWKVNGGRLALIIATFAIGGSLTGYAGRRVLGLLPISSGWPWILAYILLITLLWPLAVILVSIPMGQFGFFRNYLRKMGARIGGGKAKFKSKNAKEGKTLTSNPIHIALFASGAGSNAQKIIDHFRDSAKVKLALIVCNKPGAGVLDIAGKENIPVLLIERERFFRGDSYLPELRQRQIDFIVLAGFLWKIPSALIQAYPSRIVNIHPALLPLYGGKGMYGQHVHEAVIAAGDSESGITIHYVDEQYDHGAAIFQARCPIQPGDTADTLAHRIHQLEHQHYPRVIAEILSA